MEIPPVEIDVDLPLAKISRAPQKAAVQAQTRIQLLVLAALIFTPTGYTRHETSFSSLFFRASASTQLSPSRPSFASSTAPTPTVEEQFDEWLASLSTDNQPSFPEAVPDAPTYRVKGKLLSVRTKPTKRGEPVFMLEHGMEIPVMETRELETGTWFGFKLQGEMYWVPQESEDTHYREDSETYEGYKILIELRKRHLTLLRGDGEKWAPEKTYDIGLTRSKKERFKRKEERGDERNPVGTYFVAGVNQFPESGEEEDDDGPRPGLHISYPNKDDAWRGVRSGLVSVSEFETVRTRHRQKRVPEQDTELGSDIMIHDGGARDNTVGCFSVSHRHMKELLKRVPKGTPVEIVL